jgi:hypothetical protein
MNRRTMLRSMAAALGTAATGISWRAAVTGACSESKGAGYAINDVVYDDQSATDDIASVRLVSCPARESLLSRAIPRRHTNRGPYIGSRLSLSVSSTRWNA